MSIETIAPGQSDAGDCSPSSLTPERDELWAKHDGLTPKCCAEMIALAGTLQRERDEAREQLALERALADRLAGVLELYCADDSIAHHAGIADALAAWKEARND